MSTVRALVLRSAGTNCDAETVRALQLAGAPTDLLHLNRVAERPARLEEYGVLVIAGGFSYGDYVAAGRVFGVELLRTLREPLARFVEGGGLVLGICNGFQILLETGLLYVGPEGPAEERGPRAVALYGNESDRFECRWVTLEAQDCACPWLVPGELLPCPVAHAEGRFAVRDEATLRRLMDNRQIAWRYTAPGGGAAEYPDNPNGSVDSIAGICDPSGRVLGLMPHPERNLTPRQHPHWTRLDPGAAGKRTEGEGLAFFRRLIRAATEDLPTLPTLPTQAPA